MATSCEGCREDGSLPFEFAMAFQPIIDVPNQRVWGYEALVRGLKGEPAFSILDQLSEHTRYRSISLRA